MTAKLKSIVDFLNEPFFSFGQIIYAACAGVFVYCFLEWLR